MDQEARISIGITAYSEGPWLREAWQSVLAQTDARWEAVLVLDGGASPPTAAIFESLEHRRLRKIRLDRNLGPYPTRDRAIRAANTDWYAHLDADDRLPPDAVALILDAVDRHPAADFVVGGCLHFGGVPGRISQPENLSASDMVFNPGVNGVSPIRVSLYEGLGGYGFRDNPDAPVDWDWDFWVSVAEAGSVSAEAEGVIYERRHHDRSIGSQWEAHRVESVQTIIERHPDFYTPERKRLALGKAHEITARVARTQGRRGEAALHARRAIALGFDSLTMQAILDEETMPGWRYSLRRAARLADSLSKEG